MQVALGQELAVDFFDPEGEFRRELEDAIRKDEAETCRAYLEIIGLL